MKKDDWRDNFYEVEMYVQVEYRHKVLVKAPQGSRPDTEAIKAMKLMPLEQLCDPNFLWTQDLDEVFQPGDILGCEEAEGYKNTPEHYKDALATAINCTTNAERES